MTTDTHTDEPIQVVLCSASPARAATLRSAGIEPETVVSGVDESIVHEETTDDLARTLAVLKARAVHEDLPHVGRRVLIGCDSVLDLGGIAYGKPWTPDRAVERWREMRGTTGELLTGHHLIVCGDGVDACREYTAVGRTIVHFADLTDDEIDAYVATGEPLEVAGSFTLDGLGGAFVTSIEGDPHNVVGISLPLLRTMLQDAGIAWPRLWRRRVA